VVFDEWTVDVPNNRSYSVFVVAGDAIVQQDAEADVRVNGTPVVRREPSEEMPWLNNKLGRAQQSNT
jgi:hypothetical protein